MSEATGKESSVRELQYREALNEALAEEMARDGRVFLLGQGIGRRGGSYRVTAGLLDRFGAGRVVDTPISEASVTGMAVGAAIQGCRPVLEHTYIDFMMLAMDLVVNHAAKYRFITGDSQRVPLVIRTQGGTGSGAGMHHSQSLEALLYHIPGLKIAMPATPYDAKGLLKTAIRDDNPVVFIEHKMLYGMTGCVPAEDYTVPFGQAAVLREGGDCTVVTYSNMVHRSLDAADVLADEGISCDVIDLRTLVPMDRAAIEASVRKTGRLVVVAEAALRGSVASDIAAWAAEYLFDALRGPVRRISGKNTPIPYNRTLEAAVVPGVTDIVDGVRAAVGMKNT